MRRVPSFLVTLEAVIFSIVLACVSPKLAESQDGDCGNGLTWQFRVGDIGWVEPGQTSQDVGIHETPGGLPTTYRVGPGDFFRIYGGPECASDGVSWWRISEGQTFRGIAEWIPEGRDGRYLIKPFDTASLFERNFRTRIELDIAAPIVEENLQLGATGNPGGGEGDYFDCPTDDPYRTVPPAPRYRFGDFAESIVASTFEEGESVQVSLYRPDGSLHLRENIIGSAPDGCGFGGGLVRVTWRFDLSDPAGLWLVDYVGKQGQQISYRTLLTQSFYPVVWQYCEEGKNTLALDGFNANEPLEIFLTEAVEFVAINPLMAHSGPLATTTVSRWRANADNQGQLVAVLADSVTPSPLRHLLIRDANGDFHGAIRFAPSMPLSRTSLDSCRDADAVQSPWRINPPHIGEGSFGFFTEGPSVYTFPGSKGDVVNIKMERLDGNLDPFLQLFAPDGTPLVENDDALGPEDVYGRSDAQIENYVLPHSGDYVLVASGIAHTTGYFKLSVEATGAQIDTHIPNPGPAPENRFIVFRPVDERDGSRYRGIWSAVDFRDRRSPGIETYEVTLRDTAPLRLGFTWCADNRERLQENLVPLAVAFGVNDEELAESAVLVYDRGTCRGWASIVSGWRYNDQFTFEIEYILSEAIFDGTATYEAGNYTHRINITVSPY